MKEVKFMNNSAMNSVINTILQNIGNNPDAMKALMEAISETNKIASNAQINQKKEACTYIICLERTSVEGNKVYHPFVMTPPTCEDPKMLIVNNAVEAQDAAQRYGMLIKDNVYAMPATSEQVAKLTELLKKCNKRIVAAIDKAVSAVGSLTDNIDRDELSCQYLRQMMENCNGIIGSSLSGSSEIIERDIEVLNPNCDIGFDVDDEDDCYCEDEDDECDCDWCDNRCCPDHHSNW